MYAVFQSGSKQYRVRTGQIIRLEKLNIITGDIIEFNNVMMVTNNDIIHVGAPFLHEKKIVAKVIAHGRDKKITIIKFHRRKHFRKKQGHRQWFTDVKIISISD